jgi:hypothetical protein
MDLDLFKAELFRLYGDPTAAERADISISERYYANFDRKHDVIVFARSLDSPERLIYTHAALPASMRNLQQLAAFVEKCRLTRPRKLPSSLVIDTCGPSGAKFVRLKGVVADDVAHELLPAGFDIEDAVDDDAAWMADEYCSRPTQSTPPPPSETWQQLYRDARDRKEQEKAKAEAVKRKRAEEKALKRLSGAAASTSSEKRRRVAKK